MMKMKMRIFLCLNLEKVSFETVPERAIRPWQPVRQLLGQDPAHSLDHVLFAELRANFGDGFGIVASSTR